MKVFLNMKERPRRKPTRGFLLSAATVVSLSVTSNAWPDGGEVRMKYPGRGDNKSPAFEFHGTLGGNAASAPDRLQTSAVIFHNTRNSANETTANGPGIASRGGARPEHTSVRRLKAHDGHMVGKAG
jgi:hypothetical protein